MAWFRRLVEDYEARLAPAGGAVGSHSSRGKAEHERFEDGEVQFELSARGVDLADATELEVRGHAIPPVRAGDRPEVVHRSVVLLSGEFLPD